MSLGRGLCCKEAEGWGCTCKQGAQEGGRGYDGWCGQCIGSRVSLMPPLCPRMSILQPSFLFGGQLSGGETPQYGGCAPSKGLGMISTRLLTSSVTLDKAHLNFWVSIPSSLSGE